MAETLQPEFNRASEAPQQWPPEAFAALAQWFGDQLKDSYTHYEFDAHDMRKEERAITPAQKQAFVETLTEKLKKLTPATNQYGMKYIEVETGSRDFDKPDPPIWAALDALGIAQAGDQMEFIKGYIYEDGQAFAAGQQIIHTATPATPYIRFTNLDFTGCPWMRQDTRYFVLPLEAGETATILHLSKNGGAEYRETTAEEGDALVIPLRKGLRFEEFTAAEARKLHLREGLHLTFIAKAADYADGSKKSGGGVIQALDGKGLCRLLSDPCQLMTVQEPFGTGYAFDYCVMKPGDFITRTPAKNGSTHAIVPKDWMEANRRIYLPCAEDGTLTVLTELDKPVTASRPLKLKTPGGGA